MLVDAYLSILDRPVTAQLIAAGARRERRLCTSSVTVQARRPGYQPGVAMSHGAVEREVDDVRRQRQRGESARTTMTTSRPRYTNDGSTATLETSRTEAYGTPRARTITTQWHSTFRLPTQIDEPGKRTTFTHDANGNVLTKTVLDTSTSESRTWTYTYNSFGQVLTANGPRTDVSDVTTYTYYSCTTGYQCGQVQTITNALGHVTTYNTYNAHGQPLTITDPNGVVTTLTYDARQRLTSRTVGSEQTTLRLLADGTAEEGDAARRQLPRVHLRRRASADRDRGLRRQPHRLHARCDGQSHGRAALRSVERPDADAHARVQHAQSAVEGDRRGRHRRRHDDVRLRQQRQPDRHQRAARRATPARPTTSSTA